MLFVMEQTHVLEVSRGLTCATVRCRECGYAYVTVIDSRAANSCGSHRWIDRGDQQVAHRLPVGTALRRTA